MQKVFDEVNTLDKRCYEIYQLSEEILMEHAANGMKEYIHNNFSKASKILIVCGNGNNGADGIALARLLHGEYGIEVFLKGEVKSKLPKIQIKRAQSIGVKFIDYFYNDYDVVVDCLFGSGLNRELSEEYGELITLLNNIDAFKIACDIPSGIHNNGNVLTTAFYADVTLTMGALKKSFFLDMAKEYIGEIKIIDLGVSRSKYENKTNTYLLDENDLELPKRIKQDTHKGSFGHMAIVLGDKEGAAILSALAGFKLGCGLVSLVGHKKIHCEPYIMQSHFIPDNTTAIALGMGLGNYEQNEILSILKNDISKVIDADLFYTKDITKVLDKNNVVLTPHPKEFCSLLKICEIADISVQELQKERFTYVNLFCAKYPNVVLVLKGSNVLVGIDNKIYINSFGSSALSFGGSGDVLAGFITSLLAQGYCTLDAALQGTLIHTLVVKNCNKNSFSLTPYDLIEGVCRL
jgi:hydroxyethylthiazole kinase-like uncharacterized protein yjeF